ncbi:MAG TPA: L,D-transpeptidase family protein [Bacteroidia bacterium]|jgi:murein L,D-transpeptidase YcbB/YkuD|nr:L,D-transpeptidase family protein [Bacteroidia bacterium]
MVKSYLFVLLFTFALGTCRMCHHETPQTDLVEQPEQMDEHVEKQIQNQLFPSDLSKAFLIRGRTIRCTPQLRKLYDKPHAAGFWTHFGKLNQRADTFLALLRQARTYGLYPATYQVKLIDSLLSTAHDSKTNKFNAVNLAQSDLLLSDAFLTFAVHLHCGRLSKDTILPEFRISQFNLNLDSLFLLTLEKGTFRACFDSLEPKQEQYKLLKKELSNYRHRWESKPWDSLPLLEKDTAGFYRALKKMLVQTGDYDSTAKGNDSVKLSKGLKVFQKRNFLDDDGKVGKNTMRVLKLSTEQRIRQIEMNMERWRLEPAKLPKRYVVINIPQFDLKVMDEDTVYMESKVVVGLPEKPTPLLESAIQYIMLYPYWNVPVSIATKEILPVLKRDTSYLRKKNFDVLDWHGQIVDPKTINWKQYTEKHLPYRFRQREGEDNSLGIMKFNFNNKFGVYLHDTNSKRYFKKDVRALSHGCMRIENYMELAKYLLIPDSVKYPYDSLLTDILKEQQKQINLRKQIPIYTKYFTAIVDEDKGLLLFTDIYRKDEQMEKVLY